uniref:Shell protein-5 n=1 Tax=Mytilus coruscus TaxID=42192 RepID=A0A0G2YHS1_MYTCO|nr:shell protein-5 [Mytilus coruscus]
MKIVFFLVLLCIATYCQASDGQEERVNWRGKRATKIKVNLSLTNCKCNGYERGTQGGGPRPFRVVCKKGNKTNKGNGSKKITNDCTYTGNPHKCSDYNNKNQKKFYNELIAVIAPKQCGNLNLAGAPCPTGTFNTKKTCKDIDYN